MWSSETYLNDHVKDDEMGKAFSTYGRETEGTEFR
jgi:hypothetical protein